MPRYKFPKGHIAWNKGKTAKNDPRISKLAVWQGKKFSLEHRRRIAEGNKGKKMSEEAKEKIRQSHLGEKNAVYGKKQTPEHIEKRTAKIRGRKNTWLQGKKHKRWQGGVRRDRGYRYILKPNHPNAIQGYVAEHRLVIEEQSGELLDRKLVVHHIDGSRDNNNLENLQVLNRKEHSRLHRLQKLH